MTTTQAWTDMCALDDIPEESALAFPAQGREIAVYRVRGNEVYASDNLCTHGNARLCDGWLEGHEIECPLHQGRFDLRDGRALCPPVTDDIRVYPVKIDNGRVCVDVGEAD